MSYNYDRWLWLGLGAFALFAVKGISYGLHEVVRLTEITDPNPEPQPPSPETKRQRAQADSINTKSLTTLARSTNTDIAQAATALLCDRFLRSPHATDLLAADLISTDPDVRHRAQKARRILEDSINGQSLFSAGTQNHDYSIPLPPPNLRARPHEESPEEQALRRRRREAMVFNEGDRPVSQDDIIQQGGTMTDAEAHVAEQALETIARAERNRTSIGGVLEGPISDFESLARRIRDDTPAPE